MFGLNVYSLTPKTIHFQDEFLKCDKRKIYNINKMLEELLQRCNNCDAIHILKKHLEVLYKDIPTEKISNKDIYLAWQKQFKILLKKYKIKIDDLKVRVFYSEGKNNVYKAVDLAISNTVGSIASNYYTTKFCEDGCLGYTQYLHDFYKENPSLYYPISVYNEKIDNINNKIMKKINIPEVKNKKWVDDYKSSLENIKKLVEPIIVGKEKWRMIYGSLKVSETEGKYRNLLWSDSYVVNLAINEEFELTKNPDVDGKYTIETPIIYDGLENIEYYNYSRTASIRNSSNYSDFFIQTDFNVPPTMIIKEFDLHFDKFNNSWKNIKDEEVVLVNNNKGTWYNDGVTGSVFIKEEYFKKLIKKYNLKYFGFTQKYLHPTGKSDKSALELEIFLDGTSKHYKHYQIYKKVKDNTTIKCKKCIVRKEMIDEEEYWRKERENTSIKFIDDLIE